MSLVKVKCKKCNQSSTLDIGEMTQKEVETILSNDKHGFQCFGGHVEIGSRISYWEIDWSTLKEGSAMSEEEFLAELISDYDEVYTTHELQQYYEVLSFNYGMCKVKDRNTEKVKTFQFTHSPRGTRYYYA